MPTIPDVRSYYRPVQPAIRRTTSGVVYQEFLPDLQLQPFIYCYWQLKTTHTLLQPFHYRVVADGCIDIFFERAMASQSFIMGFCKKYTIFPLESNFDYFGVRFLPSMFPQLLQIPAQTLSNHFEHLENILPTFAKVLEQQVNPTTPINDIKNITNTYFINILNNAAFDLDQRFYEALLFIMKNQGVTSTQKDLQTGISPRQLRRIFNHYIGTTPKTFSKVVRFQHILSAKPSSQSLHQNPLFYDVGFYDQAHFIKDFKTLYGVTPTEAFR